MEFFDNKGLKVQRMFQVLFSDTSVVKFTHPVQDEIVLYHILLWMFVGTAQEV
jgi:hypothetical protein